MTALVEDEAGRLAYSILEVARKMGVHRRTVERMIDAGRLAACCIGVERRVTAASLASLLSPPARPTTCTPSPASQRRTTPHRQWETSKN